MDPDGQMCVYYTCVRFDTNGTVCRSAILQSPCQFTMLPKALQVHREITYNKGPPLKGHPVKSASVNIRGAYIQYEDSIQLITLGNFLGAHGMNQHKSPINRIANLTTTWVCPGPGIENLKVQKSPKQLYREAPCNVSM